MNSFKDLTPAEIAESFVFPGPQDKIYRAALMEALRECRKQIKAKQTQESRLISRLLQLKFIKEDQLKKL